MKLHYVVDVPGEPGPGLAARLLRGFIDSGLGDLLPGLVSAWPVGGGHKPWLAGLYFRVMNLTVLRCFRKGLKESANP